MKNLIRIGYGVLALSLVAVTLIPVTVRADESSKVVEYFRKKANVPPNVPAKVVDLKDSAIKGAKEGFIELGTPPRTQRQPFLISKDGKFAVFAAVNDLSVDPYKEVMKKISLKDQPTRGPANAKVTIVEYSDFECPFCARGYNTLENQVMKQYDGKVRLVFKNFPLTSIHPWAQPAAIAGECVYAQSHDAFWKLYNYFFENQHDINPQNLKEKVDAAVGSDGIDKTKLNDCMDNQKTLAEVNSDQKEGESIGVNGTPAFFINGRLLSGAQPFEQFKAVIDSELASK
jgi:protein-disulfide isomerase